MPEMGEPADQVMSPRDERKIGRSYMLQIRQHLDLVTDIEVNSYVHKLGEKLVAAWRGSEPPEFTFFVIRNPEINAFALPGGYIGINSGLITAATNESEVASVLAHEIAHVLQRHIARLHASQGNAGLKTAATILAAILLSQQSAEAGQAALLTGIAASQQSAINYTRIHEYEADRIGIQLLSSAGYNPRGMVDFFEILRRRTSLNSSGQMEFLRTHPLTNNRISEARNNASRLSNPTGLQDSVDFQLQQMKLRVMHSNNPHSLRKSLIEGHISDNETARLYGQILLLLNSGNPEPALPLVKRLRSLQTNSASVQLLAARVALQNGQLSRSERLLSSIIDIYPDNYAATEQYLQLLNRQRRIDRAENVIQTYLRSSSNPAPDVYRKYAEVLKLKDKVTAAHEATADYFLSLENTAEAVNQLELALRSAPKDTNQEARIAARVQRVRKELRSIR